MSKHIDSANESELAATGGTSGATPSVRKAGEFNWTVSARNPLHKICRTLATMSTAEYVVAVLQGVPASFLGQLAEAMNYSVGQLSLMLGISKATAYRMQSKGDAGPMGHFEGDAVADFARLVGEAQMDAGQAKQALASAARALSAWLELPSRVLGDIPPVSILKVGIGRAHAFRLWKQHRASLRSAT